MWTKTNKIRVLGASQLRERVKQIIGEKNAANNVEEDNFLVNSNPGHLKSETRKESKKQ